MGEKRVFEGLVMDGYSGENLVMLRDGHLTHVDIRELTYGLEGKKVRITIELLDDDHLEMEKLERE
jgi:myo-inositol-hexaphosphate 3-phosphohydrolase